MKHYRKAPLIKIVLSDKIDIYEFNTKSNISVQGSHGTAVLAIYPGIWLIREIQKPLTKWQKVLKFFKLKVKPKYFIRAQRIR